MPKGVVSVLRVKESRKKLLQAGDSRGEAAGGREQLLSGSHVPCHELSDPQPSDGIRLYIHRNEWKRCVPDNWKQRMQKNLSFWVQVGEVLAVPSRPVP